MRYRQLIDQRIDRWVGSLDTSPLYDPMAYIMRLPAKRIRPVAVLMSCELFGTAPEAALDVALGLELFHNFTLMHDDIMDRAPLRRGQPTVHEKWNVNTAILSGDAMLVKAYEALATDQRITTVFNEHALAVCEGQQSDMDFELRQGVSLEDYLGMIKRKTALLLACATRCGAIIGGAERSNEDRMGAFGEHLGMAFQLRDDLLDAFGDQELTGKRPGGDLRAGKKTWLLIRGLELEKEAGSNVLRDQLKLLPEERDITVMLATLEGFGLREAAEAEVAKHEDAAIAALENISVPQQRKAPLRELAGSLMARTH